MEILHVVFVDLKIAYDRVPRDLIWWVLDKMSVPRGHIYIIKGVMSVACKLLMERYVSF